MIAFGRSSGCEARSRLRWRQKGDAPPLLADHGTEAAKWCAWSEMARFLEDAPAIIGLEGRLSDRLYQAVISTE